jgi:tetratricopeptide (TPR) repeat protein
VFGPKHKGTPPTEPFEEIMEKAAAALRAGDSVQAERLYGQATVVKPASAAAWHGKGQAFFAQSAWDKALRCLSIAVKFDPKSSACRDLAPPWRRRQGARGYGGTGGSERRPR